MGLFSKKPSEPVVYPAVERTAYVPAALDDVIAHLSEYGRLWSAKRAEEHELSVAVIGEWTALRLPDAVHPWQLHNLAFWMLDVPGRRAGEVIAESGAGPDHHGYRLVRDPEVPDALCGWDDAGVGWTVHVPGNDVVRGDDVPVPRAISAPSGRPDWRTVTVLLEDPRREMNWRNEPTVASRAALADRDAFPF